VAFASSLSACICLCKELLKRFVRFIVTDQLHRGLYIMKFVLQFLANVNSCSRSLYTVARPSVVCLSPETLVPYILRRCNFRQFFYGIGYLGHPLTSTKNFKEIVKVEPLRRGSLNTRGYPNIAILDLSKAISETVTYINIYRFTVRRLSNGCISLNTACDCTSVVHLRRFIVTFDSLFHE